MLRRIVALLRVTQENTQTFTYRAVNGALYSLGNEYKMAINTLI